MRRWLDTAPEAMEYWEQVGAIEWEIIPDLADYHSEAAGALDVGRYLTNAVIDGGVLGEWRDRLRVSPNFPVGMTYAEMHVKGRRSSSLGADDVPDEETEIAQHAGVPAFGKTDVAAPATDRAAIRSRSAPASWRASSPGCSASPASRSGCRTPVTDLLTDDAGRVDRRDGRPDPTAPSTLHGPVVLATSTYDWNPLLVKEFLGLDPEDFSSLAPTSLTGDGITMARAVGAAVARVPATRTPDRPRLELALGDRHLQRPRVRAAALPHGRHHRTPLLRRLLLGHHRRGRTEPRRSPPALLPRLGRAAPSQVRTRPHSPGGEYPEEFVSTRRRPRHPRHHARASTASSCAHGRAGSTSTPSAARTRSSVAAASPFILRFGGDPSHSPSPVLGPLVEPPFYGTRLKFVGTGIGSSGLHADADAHVLDEDGAIIPGLYAVGSVAALTTMGSGYNSGFALGRGPDPRVPRGPGARARPSVRLPLGDVAQVLLRHDPRPARRGRRRSPTAGVRGRAARTGPGRRTPRPPPSPPATARPSAAARALARPRVAIMSVSVNPGNTFVTGDAGGPQGLPHAEAIIVAAALLPL